MRACVKCLEERLRRGEVDGFGNGCGVRGEVGYVGLICLGGLVGGRAEVCRWVEIGLVARLKRVDLVDANGLGCCGGPENRLVNVGDG